MRCICAECDLQLASDRGVKKSAKKNQKLAHEKKKKKKAGVTEVIAICRVGGIFFFCFEQKKSCSSFK